MESIEYYKNDLPSIDGKIPKSRARHERETAAKTAKANSMSTTCFRRCMKITKWGSEKDKELLRAGKLKIYPAYLQALKNEARFAIDYLQEVV